MKLFTPGPVYVRPEILAEMARPMLFSHRDKEFSALHNDIVSKIQKLLSTENPVFLSTSSGTGLMEAAVRNCVEKKCLNLVCGAFSGRWQKLVVECGRESKAIEVPWGYGITPDMVRRELETGNYDAVCLTHNETSTGVMNPLYEIAEVVRDFPNMVFLVDTVSSMAGIKIEVDKLGIDVCLSSVQKCFGLPPGFSLCTVSQKALEKSKKIAGRGHYFDFMAFLKYYEKGQTISTPSIPHMYALNKQLDFILEEGIENRFLRHKKMAMIVRKWARTHFELFAQEGFESDTLTVIKNTRGIDIKDLNGKLRERGKQISDGYGDIKGKTFRIAHMADLQESDIQELLCDIDEIAGLSEIF